MMRAVTPTTAQSSTFAIAEPVISRRPKRGFGANGTSELPGLGKSSIKRSAIALDPPVSIVRQAIALSTTPISARQRPSAARIIQLPPSKIDVQSRQSRKDAERHFNSVRADRGVEKVVELRSKEGNRRSRRHGDHQSESR